MTERQRASREAGITLIEVILYVLLSSLILIPVTMILITSISTQRDVASVTEATSRGQSMGAAIERAVRNGLALDVSADGAQLKVRTSLGGSLACQAFLLTDGQARVAQTATLIAADPTTWSDWEQGIGRDGMSPYFVATGTNVAFSFMIATDSAPVRIAGEAAPRTVASGVSAPCW